VHDGNPLVTANIATMAREIKRELDAVLSGVFDFWKNPSIVTYWKNGEPSYWPNGEQFKISYWYKVLSYVISWLEMQTVAFVILKCCECTSPVSIITSKCCAQLVRNIPSQMVIDPKLFLIPICFLIQGHPTMFVLVSFISDKRE